MDSFESCNEKRDNLPPPPRGQKPQIQWWWTPKVKTTFRYGYHSLWLTVQHTTPAVPSNWCPSRRQLYSGMWTWTLGMFALRGVSFNLSGRVTVKQSPGPITPYTQKHQIWNGFHESGSLPHSPGDNTLSSDPKTTLDHQTTTSPTSRHSGIG